MLVFGSSLPASLQSNFKVTEIINLRLDSFSMEKYRINFSKVHLLLMNKNVFQVTGCFYKIQFWLFLLDESKEYKVHKAHFLK